MNERAEAAERNAEIILANYRALQAEVERLRKENERLRYAVKYALAYDFTNAVGFYDVENVLQAAIRETEAE